MSSSAPVSILCPLIPPVDPSAANSPSIGQYSPRGPFALIAIGPRSETDAVIIDTPNGSHVVSVGMPLLGPIEGPIKIRPWIAVADSKFGSTPLYTWYAPNLNADPPVAELIFYSECTAPVIPTKRAPSRRSATITRANYTNTTMFGATGNVSPLLGIYTAGRKLTRFLVRVDQTLNASITLSTLRFSVYAFSQYRPAREIANYGASAGPTAIGVGVNHGRRLALDSSGNYELALPTPDDFTLKVVSGVDYRDSSTANERNLSITVADEEADYLVLAARSTTAYVAEEAYALECYATTLDAA